MDRYLHFDSFDVRMPDISSRCSACGREFLAEVKPTERLEDVVQRIRDDFERHECGSTA